GFPFRPSRTPFRVLGGSRLGVSAMDSGICQTSTASPAEPGGLPFVLEQVRRVLNGTNSHFDSGEASNGMAHSAAQ
ncbi:MAG TPA: hypothetical protein VMG82_35780, partial [Candidatus Sulfotelmatobacter sp.]|nr:hypothetical protein [Candidatus Sulfotelmatobacter sp.]